MFDWFKESFGISGFIKERWKDRIIGIDRMSKGIKGCMCI